MLRINSWQDFLLLIGLRYFLLAGIFFLIWYIILKRRLSYKKIQPKFPANTDYMREVFFSSLSIFIFSLVPTTLLLTPLVKYTQFYRNIHDHSMLYFWLAFPLMLVIHDAYFYFTHRLMHHPKLFKAFHLLHPIGRASCRERV